MKLSGNAGRSLIYVLCLLWSLLAKYDVFPVDLARQDIADRAAASGSFACQLPCKNKKLFSPHILNVAIVTILSINYFTFWQRKSYQRLPLNCKQTVPYFQYQSGILDTYVDASKMINNITLWYTTPRSGFITAVEANKENRSNCLIRAIPAVHLPASRFPLTADFGHLTNITIWLIS